MKNMANKNENEIREIVLQAISETANTNNPEKFAEMNSTVYETAIKAVKIAICETATPVDPHETSRYFYERLTGNSYDEYVDMLKSKGFAIEAPQEKFV